MQKNIVVIKIWTNALLDGKWDIDKKIIVSLASQIYKLNTEFHKKVVLISSGAVWLGKDKIENKLTKKFSKTEEKQILASIWQPVLINEYQKAFDYYDIVVAQALLTRTDFADRKKYLSMRNVLSDLIENNIVPIINENDVLSAEELDFSDNDQLSAYVAGMLGAESLIILSDINGLYTKHPSLPDAKKIDIVNEITEDIMQMADTNVKTKSGTWWMLSKLQTAKLVMNLGVSMHIAYAKIDNILLDIVWGESVGTAFVPVENKKVSGIRAWLATGAYPKWKIYVSTIIADLLKDKKRSSILASGICKISGDFDKQDVIEVISADDKTVLWHGIVKFDDSDLENVLWKSEDKRKNTIVIHTDYFLAS